MKRVIENAVENANSSDDKGNKAKSNSEEELEDIVESAKADIKVVGTGGSGNNTMSRLDEIGVRGANVVAMNTDAQHLMVTPANEKILLGREVTKGLGAGSDPSLGEEATKESMDEILESLEGSDLIFVTCGLGGGTGTGSSPLIAQAAKEIGALAIGVVTLPFSVEGKGRMENALNGLKKLRKETDTVIVIPNDKLLEIVPDLPINAAFKVADEILVNAVKGITEMITLPGLVNLDYADVRTVLSNGGAAMIGLGESDIEGDSEGRALEAVEDALNSPLLDIDVSDATRALVNVSGGADMSLREAEMIVEAVSSKIHSNAHIIWGATIDEDLQKNRIEAMIVIAGGRFPYLDERSVYGENKEETDLGVEYVE